MTKCQCVCRVELKPLSSSCVYVWGGGGGTVIIVTR